jgi:hypothetical protein
VSDRYEIRKTPFCAYLYEGEECVASFNDAVKAGRIAAALNAQPQASAGGKPVAWQIRQPRFDYKWSCVERDVAELCMTKPERYEVRALGVIGAAPQPQASAEDVRALWGVVANAGFRSPDIMPRWAHVGRATGLGSTKAQELCKRFDRDPDELVGGSASLGVGK